MHGEYKVPGGKLVVVDLDVVDERLTNFRLSGDFFLEPDSALESINEAVNGLPADSDSAWIAAAVKGALPDDALFLGLSRKPWRSPSIVCLSSARSWTDYEWQLIHDEAYPPVMQMALDQVLSEEVGARAAQTHASHLGVG